MTHLDVLAAEGRVLAAAVGRRPDAVIPTYPAWSTADLGRHVGRIHRWATAIVASRAVTRPPFPDVAGVEDDDVVEWLLEGCGALVTVLAEAGPDDAVWTFVDGRDTVSFWHRRMAIETALHRWDAQDAIGDPRPADDWLALDAVDEAIEVYLRPGLAGAATGGTGKRVRLAAGGTDWLLRLGPAGLDVGAAGGQPDATVHAEPMDAWLFLVGRLSLHDLAVEGDRTAAVALADAIAMVPGPG